MLLFDIIRDWFVMNIWGGFTSTEESYSGFLGLVCTEEGNTDWLTTAFGFLPINVYSDNNSTGQFNWISIGDWLSSISTIIVMILLCIVFGLMVRWLFRLTSGLIQGRG